MASDAARAKSLFLNASDLADPAERAAYLERECGGDEELRGRVEALLRAKAAPLPLAAEAGATVHFEPAPVRPESTGEYTPQSDEAPHLVPTTDYRPQFESGLVIAGRYTLVQKIGEGGMGEVWVAKQTEPVKRKVALKLIKTGMDSKAVLARFEQERQALALMDHPNIARVLDGGMTPTGQPFFVMELVNGLPLNKFGDEMKLTPKERLELFVPICQAVQHAHQKGIVHRDLKPANILVTVIDAKPVPKVIDFGVAKATAGKLTDESMSTQFGAIVGTLEYMSPEQAGFAGEDIDTRADIYSLGVILYEMLTGLKPIDAKRLKKAAFTEMVRIIREEEPLKPSTRLSTDESLPSLAALRQTEPKKLVALLRGELDWVVIKCLEKQRERRYETANALSRDIQRVPGRRGGRSPSAERGLPLQEIRPPPQGPGHRGQSGDAGAAGRYCRYDCRAGASGSRGLGRRPSARRPSALRKRTRNWPRTKARPGTRPRNSRTPTPNWPKTKAKPRTRPNTNSASATCFLPVPPTTRATRNWLPNGWTRCPNNNAAGNGTICCSRCAAASSHSKDTSVASRAWPSARTAHGSSAASRLRCWYGMHGWGRSCSNSTPAVFLDRVIAISRQCACRSAGTARGSPPAVFMRRR